MQHAWRMRLVTNFQRKRKFGRPRLDGDNMIMDVIEVISENINSLLY
jgi:hypothetical protein